MKTSKISFFIFIFLFLVSLARGVLAIEAGTLGIRPANPDPTQPFGKSWFIYTAEAGKEINDQVEIINLADAPIKTKVWAADATTTPDGAYTIEEESTEIGTWITFPDSGASDLTIDLAANEKKTIDFILKIPENAEVGDHMGAIMAQTIGETGELKIGEGEIAPGVKIVTRVGARVYLTVPGEIVRIFEFSEFSWQIKDGKFYFILSFKNGGNIRIEPTGQIIIKNIFGMKIDEIKIPTRVVFPKGKIVLPVEWENWKEFFWVRYGGFVALAKVTYGPGLEVTRELRAIALPWHVPAIFGGLILLIIIILVIRQARKKRERKLLKEYIVGSDETIETIASKFGMNWKKLAKINKLKPPYTLKEGQKIFVLKK